MSEKQIEVNDTQLNHSKFQTDEGKTQQTQTAELSLYKRILKKSRLYIWYLLRMLTYTYLITIGCMLPLYFVWRTAYQEIGSNKAAFFKRCGFGIGACFAVTLVFYGVILLLQWMEEHKREKQKFALLLSIIIDRLSITDWFAFIYLTGLGLSYYYTNYRESSLLGAQGWYMGLLPQLVLIGSYFAISRFVRKKEVKWVLFSLLFIAFLIFLLGLLNRYQINPLGMESSGPDFISTIGNINWYCGYWSVLFPIGACGYILYEGKPSVKLLLGLFSVIGFATGITQGSDSGILVIAAFILIMGLLCGKNHERIQNYLQQLFLFCFIAVMLGIVQFWWPEQNQYITNAYTFLTGTKFPLICGVLVLTCYILATIEKIEKWFSRLFLIFNICILILTIVSFAVYFILLILNTKQPGSIGFLSDISIFRFNEKWASSRGATWTSGIRTWLSADSLHKVVGVGPDSMAGYIYNGPDEELLSYVKSIFGSNRLTNAHNEWITVLVNTGIIGLAGFAGMLISTIVKCYCKNRSKILVTALGLGIACYTIHNVFSFQQTMNITQMCMILGLIECLFRAYKGETKDDNENPDCRR